MCAGGVDGSRVGLLCENCDCLLLQAVHDVGTVQCMPPDRSVAYLDSNPIVWAYGR